jgi:hypothetical protein
MPHHALPTVVRDSTALQPPLLCAAGAAGVLVSVLLANVRVAVPALPPLRAADATAAGRLALALPAIGLLPAAAATVPAPDPHIRWSWRRRLAHDSSSRVSAGSSAGSANVRGLQHQLWGMALLIKSATPNSSKRRSRAISALNVEQRNWRTTMYASG